MNPIIEQLLQPLIKPIEAEIDKTMSSTIEICANFVEKWTERPKLGEAKVELYTVAAKLRELMELK